MKSSWIIAGLLAVAAVLWIGSGVVLPAPETPEQAEQQAAQEAAALPKVRVRQSAAEPHVRRALVQGRTEASRRLELRARTEGKVAEIGAQEGRRLKDGALVARIAMDERQAALQEMRARVEQYEKEYAAGIELEKKNFRAETAVAATRAQLEAARAALDRIELDIERTRITAPFEATLADRPVELGDFLQVGDPVGMLVDLDPILVVGDLSEQQIGKVEVGAVARARLVDGREVEGIVRYVAPTAREATRTFRVEIEVTNPDDALVEGLTAAIDLPLERLAAHRISPAAISLDDEGRTGIKLVDDGNVVRFAPIRIIADSPEGLWIVGLPERVRLITVGHEYVVVGQEVEPVMQDAPSPPTTEPTTGPGDAANGAGVAQDLTAGSMR